MQANLLSTVRLAGLSGVSAAVLALSFGGTALAGDYAPPGGTIAYALTSLHWATYQKDAKRECPDGMNLGPREEFKALFPDVEHNKYTLLDTQLRREVDNWYPTTAPEPFAFHQAGGPIALGMNLDGKDGPHDFTSPDGTKGIDNQLYRALGCIYSYRSGPNDFFDNEEIGKDDYNRLIIELTGVQSLENSPHVEVDVYRGLDPLLTDATGNGFLPGGTERIDTRWGRKFIQHFDGKIVDGVLMTEPHDFTFPWATFNLPADEYMRAARFELKLTPKSAEGMIGGYADIETWYLQTMKSESTHHQSYGQLAQPSLYKAFRRLADAYPDPKTGQNTAISSALRAQFVQVFVLHPQNRTLEAANTLLQRPYAGPPFPRAPADELAEAGSKLARAAITSKAAGGTAAAAAVAGNAASGAR
jgi:hypothetical protein